MNATCLHCHTRFEPNDVVEAFPFARRIAYDPAKLRSAARRSSTEAWSRRDPQNPKSLWWHTAATFVGLRVVAEVDNSAK